MFSPFRIQPSELPQEEKLINKWYNEKMFQNHVVFVK